MPSPKLNPKLLSYDTALPPFLQKLHGEFTSTNDGRHERAIARPKRPRDAAAEEEDEPAYVDAETGEVVSGEVVRGMAGKGGEGGKEGGMDGGDGGGEEGKGVEGEQGGGKGGEREKEKLAGIGGAKKRKVGKVIGGDRDGEASQAQESDERADPSAGEATKVKGTKKEGQGAKDGEGAKAKKKTKKVKLSFGDD